jgi:CDP-Glycerol:Poly(glycerophosphate) glycerophosphotransferase
VSRPALFVAREPDETLRTFIPIIAELRRRGRDCCVLFHHQPSPWALEELRKLGAPTQQVLLPEQRLSGRLAPFGELWQFRQTKRLARHLLNAIDPAAVVVIQDTLLLERFLVREANRRGRGTLVVQWAFTYPQAMYDRLTAIKRGDASNAPGPVMGQTIERDLGGAIAPGSSPCHSERSEESGPSRQTLPIAEEALGNGQILRCAQNDMKGRMFPGGHLATVRSSQLRASASSLLSAYHRAGATVRRTRPYVLLQRLLGVRFDLVNSYGGGEARVFAVMGAAFRDQFLAQGVRKERIEVTGHPLHDAAFAQRQDLTPSHLATLKRSYGLPAQARVVLYATQPVLWRAVITREQLVENVQALARAVAALGPEWLLLVKLHPRESIVDYRPALSDDLPIRLVDSGQIAELIAPAEVFISSSSSTVLLAMMLDKPIVTVNFNEVPHFDYFESVGGTLHVRSPVAAAEALRQAAFDPSVRRRLATERASVLGRYARSDGCATERLADLVEEVSGWC